MGQSQRLSLAHQAIAFDYAVRGFSGGGSPSEAIVRREEFCSRPGGQAGKVHFSASQWAAAPLGAAL